MITPEYLEEQKRLHAQGYGGKGDRWARIVFGLASNFDCRQVLDYGAGQGTLALALEAPPFRLKTRNYDPAIERWSGRPAPADLVVCTDVLEHVEPEHLEAVLDDLTGLARKALFLVVSTRECSKWLTDGRNAHISVHPPTWWRAALGQREGFLLVQELQIKPEKQWCAVYSRRTA